MYSRRWTLSSGELDITRPKTHGDVLLGLWKSAADGRLPHALLFSGPSGVGKFLSAGWFAAGLLCARGPGEPCLTCGPCKRVRSGSHPDLFVVDAAACGQDQLTIAFITPREKRSSTDYDGPCITDFLSLQAMEGGWRVVVVREVERMNEQAQNAFLKTLEEPGVQTVLILECSRPASLLATLRSRLVQVGFGPLPVDQARAILEEAGLEPDDARDLARWCSGAPGRALELASRRALEMRGLVLGVAAGELSAPAAAAALWELEGEYPGKTASAQRRTRAEVFLDVGLELWRDQERLAVGVPAGELPHGAVIADLALPGQARRARRLEAWFSARQDVGLNLTAEGLIDRALAATTPSRGVPTP